MRRASACDGKTRVRSGTVTTSPRTSKSSSLTALVPIDFPASSQRTFPRILAVNGSGIGVTAAQPQPLDNRLQLVGMQGFVNNATNEFPYGLAPITSAPFGDVPIPFLESDSLFTLENEISSAVNGTFGGDIIADISNDLSFIDAAGKQQFYGSRMAFLAPVALSSILPSPTALTAGMIDPADDPGSSREPTGFTYMQGSDNGVAFAGDAQRAVPPERRGRQL